MKPLTRRNFLQHASRLAISSSAYAASTHLGMIGQAAAHSSTSTSNYKALICLFFPGGMDSFNVLVPSSNSAGTATPRADYTNSRQGNQAIGATGVDLRSGQLIPLTHSPSVPASKQEFSVHEQLSRVPSLYNSADADAGNPVSCAKLAFVANLGSLITHIPNAQGLDLSNQNIVPASIGSHNDQIKQWQTLDFSGQSAEGWLSRLAHYYPNPNTANHYMTHISAKRNNFAQNGLTNPAYVVGGKGVPLLDDRGIEARDTKIENLLSCSGCDSFNRNVLEQMFIETSSQAIGNSTDFQRKFEAEDIRSVRDTSASRIMDGIYKSMLVGKSTAGVTRQTFFVSLGGWDDHSSVLSGLNGRLKTVNSIIESFANFLDEHHDIDATLFTASDFGRTLNPNGDGASAGTDHAWGGNHMVIGRKVVAGDVYGEFPDTLELGEGRDYDGRGRLVPTTGTDEYYAKLAKWFGVEETQLGDVLPNYGNFPRGASARTDLDFILPE